MEMQRKMIISPQHQNSQNFGILPERQYLVKECGFPKNVGFGYSIAVTESRKDFEGRQSDSYLLNPVVDLWELQVVILFARERERGSD